MKPTKHNYLALLMALTYLLGSYKGYLALWSDGDAEPKQIYPCPVASLPDADRSALEKGIYIGTKAELSRYLEDFLS